MRIPGYLCERFVLKYLNNNMRDENICVISKVKSVKHSVNSFKLYGGSL